MSGGSARRGTSRQGRAIVRRWTWAPSTWAPEPINVAADRRYGGREIAADRRPAADGGRRAGRRISVGWGGFERGGRHGPEEAPRIECFTIDTGGERDGGMADDLPYARRVARHLGVKLHEVRVDSSQMAQDLEQMVVQLDEPLADPAPLNVLYISRLASEHGMKVLLSGAGGDDLFSGYRRHRALERERYWSWLPKTVRAGLRRASGRLAALDASGRRLAKALPRRLTREQRLMGYFLWADADHSALFAPEHRARLR